MGVHGEHLFLMEGVKSVKKKIITAVLLVTAIVTTPVFAVETNETKHGKYNWNHRYYTETVEYTCTGEVVDYEFDPEMQIKNQLYSLQESESEIVDTEEVAVEREEKVVTYNDLTADEVDAIKKELSESGLNYELTDTQVQGKEQTEQVTSYVMSGLVYEEPKQTEIPAIDTIEYVSPITEEQTSQSLPYQSTVLTTPYEWRDGFDLNFTLEVYDAEYFLVGSQRVYLDKDVPVLPDASKKILIEAAGLPVESFTIDSMEWTSDVYEKDGVKYRDAVTHGKQLLGEYQINYADQKAVTGSLYDVTATYTVSDADYDNQVAAETIYHCKAKAVYKATAFLTGRQLVLLCGVAVLVVLAGFILILLLNRKRKKKVKTYHVAQSEQLVNTTKDTFINSEK